MTHTPGDGLKATGEHNKQCPACGEFNVVDKQVDRMIRSCKDFNQTVCDRCGSAYTLVIGMYGVQVYETLIKNSRSNEV